MPSAIYAGPQPLLVIDGTPFPVFPGSQFGIGTGAHTIVLLAGRPMASTTQARGAGGGGNAGAGASGSGGGGGAYVAAIAETFIPGKTYTATIGVGGTAGVSGGNTTLVNTTDYVTLFTMGGGTFGQNGSTVGVGGTATPSGTSGQNGFPDSGGPNGGAGGANGDGVTAGGAGGISGSTNGGAGGSGAGGGGAGTGTNGGPGGNGTMVITFV